MSHWSDNEEEEFWYTLNCHKTPTEEVDGENKEEDFIKVKCWKCPQCGVLNNLSQTIESQHFKCNIGSCIGEYSSSCEISIWENVTLLKQRKIEKLMESMASEGKHALWRCPQCCYDNRLTWKYCDICVEQLKPPFHDLVIKSADELPLTCGNKAPTSIQTDFRSDASGPQYLEAIDTLLDLASTDEMEMQEEKKEFVEYEDVDRQRSNEREEKYEKNEDSIECQKEFCRFWKEQVKFDKTTSKTYYESFAKCGYDDIRIVPMLGESILNEEISMKKLHLTLLMRSVESFKKQHHQFKEWLQNVGDHLFEKYATLFSNFGILTLESLSFHMKDKNHFLKIGIADEDDIGLIMNGMKGMQKKRRRRRRRRRRESEKKN